MLQPCFDPVLTTVLWCIAHGWEMKWKNDSHFFDGNQSYNRNSTKLSFFDPRFLEETKTRWALQSLLFLNKSIARFAFHLYKVVADDCFQCKHSESSTSSLTIPRLYIIICCPTHHLAELAKQFLAFWYRSLVLYFSLHFWFYSLYVY